MYVIKGNDGWLFGFMGKTPIWTDERAEAMQYDFEEAQETKANLSAWGYKCELKPA